MSRKRISWTPHRSEQLAQIREVLEEWRDYLPMTLRQVYYQLVGKGYLENKRSTYSDLSGVIKWARLDGLIGWNVIEDRTRSLNQRHYHDSKEAFVEGEKRLFLKGYSRNLLTGQQNYIEVWIEKDALSSLFERICDKYMIPVVVCRGFSSVSYIRDFVVRANERRESGQDITMIYFGDFDPSGMEMLESMKITIEEEFEFPGINYRRVGLLKDDIYQYNLPHSPKALKESDSRAEKFIREYGRYAVELDALRPDVLSGKLREAIEYELDMTTFEKQVEIYQKELDELKEIRERVFSNI